ncbi:CHAT domain protein, partial [Rhizoctonia solani AG-3 Rhs1AP]
MRMILSSVLATLWYNVVKPILDHLGYMDKNASANLPHITWCPTSTLSFLPLHAAGDYGQSGCRVFDYTVSSYTPTLTALLTSSPDSLSNNCRVLAVGQANTAGHSSLPGTIRELAYVQTRTKHNADYSQLIDSQATVPAVLDAMKHHDWVHFACHAHQNVNDPTKSGFSLHNGTLDLAAINRQSFKGKGLAFLSACQTATGDEGLADEAVHLASGMLMAGYASVIATMWSVDDGDAPLVADKVYAQLMKGKKVENGEAGRALHNAVATLRETVGEEKFERWMPYIHIGS